MERRDNEAMDAGDLNQMDHAEAREIADAEMRNDFAHTDGTIDRIRAAYRAKRGALRQQAAAPITQEK